MDRVGDDILTRSMLIINNKVMQVPPGLKDEQDRSINKGHIYISESSPPQVSQAYFKQFQEDFNLFLRSRSDELVVGGQMVLILLGRRGQNHVDRGNSFLWELLSLSFAKLVSEVSMSGPLNPKSCSYGDRVKFTRWNVTNYTQNKI